jgi:predicted TIM-barrel fold metal-dependent hydrolase
VGENIYSFMDDIKRMEDIDMKDEKRIVIGVHNHIFNAAYLPVEGIILSFFTENKIDDNPTTIQRMAAWAMAILVTKITPEKFENNVRAAGWIEEVENDSFVDLALYFSGEVAKYVKRRADSPSLPLDDDAALIEAVDWICTGAFEDAEETAQSPQRSLEDAIEYLRSLDSVTIAESVKRFILWLSNSVTMDAQKIRFFLLMISSSPERLADHLINSYSSPDSNIDARLFVHHMMDMEYAYKRYDKGRIKKTIPSKPGIEFPEQIDRMEKINKEHADKLLGFVAFDPGRENSLGLVIKAISEQGFCGVKFYPSMGYLPTGEIVRETKNMTEDLYKYCVDKDIPILTHCKPGAMKGRYKWDHCSNPANWAKVLKDYPDLTLCFGHAGAGIYDFNIAEWSPNATDQGSFTEYGWFADEKEWINDNMKYHFAKGVVDLCEQHGNVYCDLSILSDLLPGRSSHIPPEEAKQRLTDTLKRLLFSKPTEPPKQLPERIMFGTDWHMASILGSSREYLDIFLSIFSDPELAPYADRFFFKNAVSFLRLDKYIKRNKDKEWLTQEVLQAYNYLIEQCNH